MPINRIRSINSDQTINELETKWWNKNAQTIEAIWALPENIRLAVREHYLKQAKLFFLCDHNKIEPLQVIEIGCGSGWVGRIITEPNVIDIIGLDLSEEQIQIANQEAIKANLSESCKYYCQNLADFVLDKNSCHNSVLIHAILHHLSWQEIHNVFAQISILGSGTKIFIYEPVYLRRDSSTSSLLWRINRKLIKFISNFPYRLGQILTYNFKKSYNKDLAKDLDHMTEEASKNDWVLSPKEVVFEESELIETLKIYCKISDRYLCNYTSVKVGQLAAMYDNKELHHLFSRFIIPLSKQTDNFLFSCGLLNYIKDDYVFMGYECILK